MLIYYIMYNRTLNDFSFDDIIDVFICYIVLCNILIFCFFFFVFQFCRNCKFEKVAEINK